MGQGQSELGAFRAIERAAARWVAVRAKTDHRWAKSTSLAAYASGWIALTASVFLSGFGVVPFIGGAAIAGIAIATLVAATLNDQRIARGLAVKQEYASDLHAVCAYIESRIAEVEAERLGEKGEVTLLLQRVERMRAEAAALHRKIGQRVAIRRTALLGDQELRDAEQALASFNQDLAELRRFADALRAAFTAARQEVHALVDPDSDFNLRKRQIELKAEAGQVHRDVRVLIAGSVTRIQGALDRIQSDLKELLVETGIHAALELPIGEGTGTGFAAQEEVIRTFVQRAHALELPFRPVQPTRATEAPGGAP